MSTGTLVPATALSRYTQTWAPTQLAIGTQVYVPTGNPNPDMNYFWYVVVDLTNLNVVVNEVLEDETSVPPDVQKYAGNAQYFLFVITNVANGYNIPQGNLYTFLKAIGSGPLLDRGEQIIEQLGTGMITSYSYILAASMAEGDTPGFEMFSTSDYVILTMQFLPVTVDGKTIYAPVQSGNA
jgi:hypothetical protein